MTAVKTINARPHLPTTFDPGRGLPLTVTDANNRVTRTEYDALGRLVNGWSAVPLLGRQDPDVKITYQAAKATDSVTRPAR